ncbi:hypothetical protein MPH_10061 [Macrophomina phaseolina MS6]|uniref:Uncharacterized protein n=1 Tax=Macrophomina phaseolina (strain MS6) TaxID=1126212 RepID=K2RDZ9_MACPH|nr:hypothetical protein MPH_10061 [Macrophomina phaseolina MS6]
MSRRAGTPNILGRRPHRCCCASLPSGSRSSSPRRQLGDAHARSVDLWYIVQTRTPQHFVFTRAQHNCLHSPNRHPRGSCRGMYILKAAYPDACQCAEGARHRGSEWTGDGVMCKSGVRCILHSTWTPCGAVPLTGDTSPFCRVLLRVEAICKPLAVPASRVKGLLQDLPLPLSLSLSLSSQGDMPENRQGTSISSSDLQPSRCSGVLHREFVWPCLTAVFEMVQSSTRHGCRRDTGESGAWLSSSWARICLARWCGGTGQLFAA